MHLVCLCCGGFQHQFPASSWFGFHGAAVKDIQEVVVDGIRAAATRRLTDENSGFNVPLKAVGTFPAPLSRAQAAIRNPDFNFPGCFRFPSWCNDALICAQAQTHVVIQGDSRDSDGSYLKNGTRRRRLIDWNGLLFRRLTSFDKRHFQITFPLF